MWAETRLTSLFGKWLAVLCVLFAVGVAHADPSFPALTGRVVDDAGILSAATQEQLTNMLAQHEKETGNQVVVVTLSSLQGYAIEDFGYQLGRYWGIGQKGKDNGALLLIAPNEHKMRIEVGYGLEDRLTDAQSKLIIENVIRPAFRQGNFDEGVINGTTIILRVLGGDASALPTQRVEGSGQADDSISKIFMVIIFIGFVFINSLWPLLFGGRVGRGGPGGRMGGYGGGFGGFGSGSGGFSGGGFSGGGGSFGGGGASGGW